MSLSTTAIRRPVSVAMFFIGISLLGIFAFSRIGVDLLPNVNLPHIVIQTTYSNATPEEIEKQITEPLESTIGTVTGVQKVNSISKEGISVISVDFVWGTDMDITLLQVREKLDNARFLLPKDAGRPTIIRADPSASPILSLVVSFKNKKTSDSKITYVSHNSDYSEIKRLIDLKESARILFKRRIEQIDGVAQAVVTGGLEREILIEVDTKKLSTYNLSFQDISTSLKAANINLPAGSIMKGLFRYSLRTIGEFQSTDDIQQVILRRSSDGGVVKLCDIARVSENFKERDGLTRLNGYETVGLLIYKEPDENTVTIANEVKKVIGHLRNDYPEFELIIVSDQSGFISDAIENVKQEIFYGGILAVIVLFFFLGSIRNIFIIGITIPASLVLTILLLYVFKINFNIISLGGIAVGIGMLLDNSIIVIENVVSYREKGLKIRESAIRGSQEVTMPVVAATLTTIAVFLPLIFVKGIAGEIFKDQSYAIAFSLVASIITAITLIPMLSAREKLSLIKNKEKFETDSIYIVLPKNASIFRKILFWIKFPLVLLIKVFIFVFGKSYLLLSKIFGKAFNKIHITSDKFIEFTIEYYERLLLWSLNNKKKVLIITGVLVVMTILATIDIKKEFIPQSAKDEFVVELTFPEGTSLDGNAELTSKIENSIFSLNYIKHIVSNIGRVNEFDYLNKEQISVNISNLIIKLDSYENYYLALEDIRKIFSGLKNINYSFKEIKNTYTQLIQPSEYDIVIKIKNKDLQKGIAKAETIIEKIKTEEIENIKEIQLGIDKGMPEYSIQIDRDKCLTYGVNVSDVAEQIVNVVKGNYPTEFSDFDKKISINVRAIDGQVQDIENILSELVISGDKKIPISELVHYELRTSYNSIFREDQARLVYIHASLNDISIDEGVKQIENIISKIPPSREELITVGGTNDEIRNSFSGLYVALLISVILMYMILASEFESFLFPFIIIFSVPLGLIGGILLLYIFGESISIISLMGLIILVGIADNDAVVKVEFILRKRQEGLSIKDAIIQAGRDRFRPIVMNSLTVMFGLLPMMIGIGAGTQLRIGLSISIFGGLFTATFLTLIIIPVLYTYMERWSTKKF